MNPNSTPLESLDISDDADIVSKDLANKIYQKIELQQDHILFSTFMNMALYQPQLGYYQNQFHKFGEQGDFITAPEMGRLFSQCLANSVFEYLNQSARADGHILEIGAGSGILAANLLLSLDRLNSLPTQYWILEPSAQLVSQQKAMLKERIPQYFDNISWLNELPKSFNGVIIANEVLDAIPCERLVFQDNRWKELGVTFANGQFKDSVRETENEIPVILSERLTDYSEGYVTEFRPLINGWIKALSSSLQRGAILLIDYGYSETELYHPQRTEGSLTCFVQHHSHDDPYQFVGLQDITAHVDFTQIARAADEADLTVSGFTTQAGFLLENGITEMVEENVSDLQRYQTSQQIQQLLMPGQMGEVVKVMLLTKALEQTIKGFSLQDHLHRL